MDYLEKVLKKTGWASIVESVVFAILGSVLVAKPEGTLKFVSTVLGIVFIIMGISKIVKYIANKGKNDYFNYDLVYGLTTIVIGLVVMFYMDIIGSILRIIIGIWIVYTSFVRFNSAIQIKNINNTACVIGMILAVLMFACGLFILLNSGAIIATIGAVMIAYSVIDIIEDIIFMRNIKDLF